MIFLKQKAFYNVSLMRKVAKQGVWFVGLRLITQVFSWVTTIFVARLLIPEDFGLMAMASILTGYISVFSELGIGSAIVQKKNINQSELSSNFWFAIMVGIVFALIAYVLAYPTAWMFGHDEIVPITKLISILFIIGAIMIVPYSIMTRELHFKKIGIIQLVSTIVSNIGIVYMAYSGYGVWTLIWGTIFLRATNTVLIFVYAKWVPSLHFSFREVRSFVKFGVNVAGAQTIFYVMHTLISGLIGKLLGTQALGYYSLGMQLAGIPNDKILSLVDQVSMPVLSRHQTDPGTLRNLFLKISQYVSILVFPFFLTGIFFAEELIPVILGEKWVPMIFIFQLLCIYQLAYAVGHVNTFVHKAIGHPQHILSYQVSSAALMCVPVLFAAQYSVEMVAFMWALLFPVVTVVWTLFTLKTIGLTTKQYLKNTFGPALFVLLLVATIFIVKQLIFNNLHIELSLEMVLANEVVLLALLYAIFLYVFEREVLREVWNLKNK